MSERGGAWVGGLWGISEQRALEEMGLQKAELYFPGFEWADLDVSHVSQRVLWVRYQLQKGPWVKKAWEILSFKKAGGYLLFLFLNLASIIVIHAYNT